MDEFEFLDWRKLIDVDDSNSLPNPAPTKSRHGQARVAGQKSSKLTRLETILMLRLFHPSTTFKRQIHIGFRKMANIASSYDGTQLCHFHRRQRLQSTATPNMLSSTLTPPLQDPSPSQ
jgi:hypothetical protein